MARTCEWCGVAIRSFRFRPARCVTEAKGAHTRVYKCCAACFDAWHRGAADSAPVAQPAERRPYKPEGAGSTPVRGSNPETVVAKTTIATVRDPSRKRKPVDWRKAARDMEGARGNAVPRMERVAKALTERAQRKPRKQRTRDLFVRRRHA